MPKAPTFLLKSRFGVFYFQRRIPAALLRQGEIFPKFFRKSLRTSNRQEAMRRARWTSVMFDQLTKRYFDNCSSYTAALRLLQEYEDKWNSGCAWGEFESYLNELDDGSNGLDVINNIQAYFRARLLEKNLGQPSEKKPDASLAALVEQLAGLVATSAPRQVATQKKSTLPLREAFQKFLTEKKINWKADSSMPVVFENEVFPLLESVSRVQDVADLSIEHVSLFKEAVLCLPANRRKKEAYRDKSLDELIGMNIPDADLLGQKTRKNYFERLTAFLNWLEKNGYAPTGMAEPLKNVVKVHTQPYQERAKYSDADLTKLFNSIDYIQGRHTEAYKYWVPLLLLFTGARANEICQLHVADIYLDAGTNIWVIDINESDMHITHKSLKRPHHQRKVPIHKNLINLGFLDYVADLKKAQAPRVFMELPYRAGANKYADKFVRWFNNTYTKKQNCNITTEKTSAHSLRHTFVNEMAHEVNALEHQYAYAIGQTPKGGVTTTRYMKPSDLINTANIFSKLEYKSIDFRKIKDYRSQVFYRNFVRSSVL